MLNYPSISYNGFQDSQLAPSVKNASCSNSRYLLSEHSFIFYIGFGEIVEASIILILTLGVISANMLVIIVINSRKYSSYIHQQPRYLLTSLALNDLAVGFLITPFGILPALIHCWPYGEIFCQIQVCMKHYIKCNL
uniref:G-protein coupled receptors family 1 profile domain-containing protein n=1 Tax=Megaselia scalaris TaxID=36166 RepID=T1GQF2_MEGSC